MKETKGDLRIRKEKVSNESGLDLEPGVEVVITQAFCPNGHNLVRREEALFDGHPGISVMIDCDDWSGEVVLSPIHGDHSRKGVEEHVKPGTKCTLSCPVCGIKLPKIGDCRCEQEGDLVGMYLREDLSEGDVVAVCNVMDCHQSRIMDRWDILSEYVLADGD